MPENKKIKRGAIVCVKYRSTKNNTRNSFGIVMQQSGNTLYLGHNFKGTDPIDITKIDINNIINIKKISVKEINNIKDLN